MSQRVKIIKDCEYKAGEVVVIDNNDAHRPIDTGYAILSKDMVAREYKTKKLTRKALNG